MAILERTGDFKFNYRGSAVVSAGIVANDPGEMAFNWRGSMRILAQTAVTLTFSTSSPLPDGTDGAAYSQTIVATGGIASYTYALTAGSLGSLSIDSAGNITGTAATGVLNFTITATDSQGNVGSKAFQITVNSSGGGTTAGDAGTGMGGFRLWIGQGIS